MYLAKELVLVAFKNISKITEDPSKQGQTQAVSALRYCFALDEMKRSSHPNCDTNVLSDKKSFVKAVGHVVSINDFCYTKNFYSTGIHQATDYDVGSNFFSVNVVTKSLADASAVFDFPKRRNRVLFSVKNGVLLGDTIKYENIKLFLETEQLRLSFALWLARNLMLDDALSEQCVFAAIRKALEARYTREAVNALLGGDVSLDISEVAASDVSCLSEKLDHVSSAEINNLFDTTRSSEAGLSAYGDEDFLHEVYMSRQGLSDIKSLLYRKKNLILQGSPGTGKTFAAKRLARLILGEADDERCDFIQFHQSSTYESFIEGFVPNSDGGFDARVGRFVRFCKKASNDNSDRPYCFVIDEINRANVSKVFGETLMLIEADHRGEEIQLPLTGETFSVPDNVYIIGMMNTADRGLALIDYALRRRFAFFEMKPALANDSFIQSVREANVPSLERLVYAVESLNKTIEKDDALGRGYQIGHSYFCISGEATEATPGQIVKYELKPLLEEYWFDDDAKVKKEIDKLLSAASEEVADE